MTSTNDLITKRCKPCEGGIPLLTPEQVRTHLQAVPDWRLNADGKSIGRTWIAKNFLAALDFIQSVARLAEDEQHHPDLHLTSYRNLAIEISTHAIGGLSENDFILAAKIDQLPIKLKK